MMVPDRREEPTSDEGIAELLIQALHQWDNEHLSRDPWRPTREELKRILQDHELWLESRKVEGVQANLDRADLMGADLVEAKLSGAHLTGANLKGADLSGAVLRMAHLRKANLTGASLRNANLVHADLTHASLGWADLSGANLERAFLSMADLSATNLSGANLREALLGGAILLETVFGNTLLLDAEEFDEVNFVGSCTIDLRTIESSWPLPVSFLRGCGLPDVFIEYIPSLIGEGIEFYSCFISYSAKDQKFADRLHADLQNNGVRCWFAPHDLPIGARTRPAIDDAIRVRDKVLLILSSNSIESDWVEAEVETAFEEESRRNETMLFPIRLDDSVMKTREAWASNIRRTRNIGDFKSWKDHDSYSKAFGRVLRDLKAPKKEKANKVTRGNGAS